MYNITDSSCFGYFICLTLALGWACAAYVRYQALISKFRSREIRMMKDSLRGGNSFVFISNDINALEHSNQVNLPRVIVVMPLKGFGEHNLHNWRSQSSYKKILVARHTLIEESIVAKSCPPPSQGKGGFGGGGKRGNRGSGMRGHDGCNGRGRGDRGRGGGRGGMKRGSKVVVESHRHERVFIAKGKEDALCTKNMVPGEDV
ncbi:hypothetical protein CsSME_00031110 [Camellia sinensis var. sinensis]